MARTKGSKNKSVAEKVEDMVEDVTALLPKASEAQAAEIVEAVEELQDIIEADEQKVKETEADREYEREIETKVEEEANEAWKEAAKPKKLVGRHPVTKEPVYK